VRLALKTLTFHKVV